MGVNSGTGQSRFKPPPDQAGYRHSIITHCHIGFHGQRDSTETIFIPGMHETRKANVDAADGKWQTSPLLLT